MRAALSKACRRPCHLAGPRRSGRRRDGRLSSYGRSDVTDRSQLGLLAISNESRRAFYCIVDSGGRNSTV